MLHQLCYTPFKNVANIENSRVAMIPVILQYICKTLYGVSHHWLALLRVKNGYKLSFRAI